MQNQSYAIALCRVSSQEQLDSNSLNRQRLAVIKAAKELSVTIPDDGWWSHSVSSKRGTNINRRDLHEMLERCKKDKRIKYLIVDEVDRFMRSMLELGYFLIEFDKLGIEVKFASQPNLRTDTSQNTLMLLLEAFKAEGSNEERQRKSITGQTAALREGRYTFSPKPGYMKGYQRGIQEVHPVRGPALKKVLIDIALRRTTPTQGLIDLNNSDFMSDGHSMYKMDKFRKIATDAFYAGVVEINKQVKVRNEKGLHEPLITLEQHHALVKIFEGKEKNQIGPRKNGNPKYPLSNLVSCELCIGKSIGRYVGYDHGNGKNKLLVYEKYRCRGCARYLTRDALHEMIELHFSKNRISQGGAEDFLDALDIVWKQQEGQRDQEIGRINHKINALNKSITEQVEAVTDPTNSIIKDELMASITRKKEDVVKLKAQLYELETQSKDDKDEFLVFAYDFINNMGNDFLNVPKENRLRCKQIMFPAGFYLDGNNKIYTPEISPLITLAIKKKDAEASINSHLVRVKGL